MRGAIIITLITFYSFPGFSAIVNEFGSSVDLKSLRKVYRAFSLLYHPEKAEYEPSFKEMSNWLANLQEQASSYSQPKLIAYHGNDVRVTIEESFKETSDNYKNEILNETDASLPSSVSESLQIKLNNKIEKTCFSSGDCMKQYCHIFKNETTGLCRDYVFLDTSECDPEQLDSCYGSKVICSKESNRCRSVCNNEKDCSALKTHYCNLKGNSGLCEPKGTIGMKCNPNQKNSCLLNSTYCDPSSQTCVPKSFPLSLPNFSQRQSVPHYGQLIVVIIVCIVLIF